MIHISSAEDSAVLAQSLFSAIEENFAGDIFSKPWLVVQNRDQANWLKLIAADLYGISANYEFVLPSELFWKLYRLIDPEAPQLLPLDREPMHWLIFDHLHQNPGLLKKAEFSLNTENERLYSQQLFEFSGTVADVFDQYQLYRPDMLLKWQHGSIKKQKDIAWQAELWKRLCEQHYDTINRPEAFSRLVKKIEYQSSELPTWPLQINFFCIASYNNPQIKLIQALSKTTDINIFTRKLPSGNNFNKLVQLLGEQIIEQDEYIKNNLGSPQYLYSSPLAGDYQLDQFKHATGEDLKKDQSISIHNCHSPRREVEVVYNKLLCVFEEDEHLYTNDVLVLVPDFERYAPVIQSVFSGNQMNPEIPVSISRSYNTRRQAVTSAFKKVLSLFGGKFSAAEVFDVLSLHPVAAHVGVEDDLDTLQTWIEENNIKLGLGEEEDGLSISWHSGIERIMLGSMMKPADFELFDDIAPADHIESYDHIKLATKLHRFYHLLRTFNTKLSTPRKIGEWISEILLLNNELLSSKGIYSETHKSIVAMLKRIQEEAEVAGFNKPVPFRIIRKKINTLIENQQAVSGAFGNGVMVSTYVPFRSVPFRFIAVLGLNEGEFPRRNNRPGFDLIARSPRIGERDLKKDDQGLFIELIQNAGRYLHLSYTGQSEHSELQALPSSCIQALLFSMGKGREFIHKEPLKKFSTTYFNNQAGHKTFDRSAFKIAQNIYIKEKSFPVFLEENCRFDADDDIISIDSLIRFFNNPSKFACTQWCNLFFNEEEILSEEEGEEFNLSGLKRYKASEIILDASREFEEDYILDYLIKSGLAPQGENGKLAVKGIFSQLQEFVAKKEQYLSDRQERDVEVNMRISDMQLSGFLNGLYGDEYIQFRTGKPRPKDYIRFWLTHLALTADSKSGVSKSALLAYDTSKAKFEKLTLDFKDSSGNHLQDLVEWYKQAHSQKQALMFFKDTSYECADRLLRREDPPEKALQKAQKKWTDMHSYGQPESEDPYVKTVFKDKNPIDDSGFAKNALRFWEPCLRELKEDNHAAV